MDKLTDVFGEAWGMHDGQCVACDLWGRVNDLGLCEECASKLERDLIRERDWDYAVDAERNAASAFGLSADDREKLRCQVVAQYGEARAHSPDQGGAQKAPIPFLAQEPFTKARRSVTKFVNSDPLCLSANETHKPLYHHLNSTLTSSIHRV
jgi:hypothetical protein